MTTLAERTPLHVPPFFSFEKDSITYAVDPDAPNWIAVEKDGAELLRWIAEGDVAFGSLVARYAAAKNLEAGKAWLHVHDFVSSLDRAGMISDAPFTRAAYGGRGGLIQPDGLRELWVQVNNNCNLTCTHCLVSSGPGGIGGLPPEKLIGLIDRAKELGVERVYITGGEPFLRRDIFDLAKHVSEHHGMEF